MKSFRTKPVNSGRLLGGGGALVLAIWLATAIASPAQTFTTLASFNGSNGRNPQATLVQGRDGNLYGTAMIGGADKWGTVFKLTRAGKVTRLYNFCSQRNCADGNSPFAGLVLSTDGNFYGTTIDGGVGPGYGTVFEITPASKLTTLYSFCSQSNCADGAFPYAGLVKATDGSFYGTTWGGGGGLGTVFKITPAGKLTTLSNFCSQGNCAGREPYAGLVQATDGNFYGTTEFGGVKDSGTVFKITRAGKLTTLYSFCSLSNCADGKNGYAGLVQATDGNLYGTTQTGGASGYGTVFKITRAGKLTTLYSFCSQNNCADGEEPFAGLVQATDGNFYGTTFYGGAIHGAGGPVFKITPAG
jgi:uncharacterized repeat protein (TIGR03803 family)